LVEDNIATEPPTASRRNNERAPYVNPALVRSSSINIEVKRPLNEAPPPVPVPSGSLKRKGRTEE
jgi:hypothetical protein